MKTFIILQPSNNIDIAYVSWAIFQPKHFDGKHTCNTMNELQTCIFPACEILAHATDTQQIVCNWFIAIDLKGTIKFSNDLVVNITNINFLL